MTIIDSSISDRSKTSDAPQTACQSRHPSAKNTQKARGHELNASGSEGEEFAVGLGEVLEEGRRVARV